MFSNNEGNVEEKFFFNPDLMEKLLPFMDSHSVLLLCQSKISCAIAILKNKMMQAKDNYDANPDTLTIMEAVCEKSSDGDDQGSIQLVSPGDKSYFVSPLTFKLLEEIKASLGFTL